MAITLFTVFAVMGIMTLIRPNPSPQLLPARMERDKRIDPVAAAAALVVLSATAVFYAVFW